MHVMGKVFVGLIIVAAAAGAYLTLDLNKKQEVWMKDIVALKKRREENDDKLRKARVEHDLVEGDVNRLMALWGHEWTAPESGPLPGGEVDIRVAVGNAQGLAAHEKATDKPGPVVYLFGDGDKEASRYLGDFQIKISNPNESGMKLTREPFGGEAESWPTGVYRVRESIPYAWKEIFSQLQTLQTLAMQNEVDEQAKLEIQEKHIVDSQKAEQLRMAELKGDEANEKASQEVKLGLVESIRRGEVQRNKILKDVDTLRRSISDSFAELEEVLDRNRQMVESESAAASSAASTGARAPR